MSRLHLRIWAGQVSRSSNRVQISMLSSPRMFQAGTDGLIPYSARSIIRSERFLPNNIQRRDISTFFSKRKLKKLEADANRAPADPFRQVAFYRELNRHNADLVVKRYESHRFAVNEACTKEYIKALSTTGQLDRVNLNEFITEVAADSGSGYNAGYNSAYPAGASSHGFVNQGAALAETGAQGTSVKSPMYVTMVEAGFKTQMWRTIRTFAVAFLVISALGALIDEKGVPGRSGPNSQVNMVMDSDKCFDDIKGAKEAKEELQEIVMYLKDPGRFTRLGGKLPKGMLLMGPPGTGKTLLARAIAGEAGVPFFYSSGSEFEEMYVGVGARRVRDLFDAAKKKAPCIIFIDEIDAIGSTRHLKDQQAMKMTLNQLLVEMDGFEQNNGIIVIGATNFAEVLDNALTRPGRFDRHVNVPLPDIAGRKEILDLYTSQVPIAEEVDVDVLARGTPGMSGADISNLVNQAALKASLDGQQMITMADLEFAKDKILMGAERKSALISAETAKLTAYHEGGHALVAIMTKGAHPVHKATIMPRGQALGMVSQLPEGDQTSMSRKQMLARLDVCMGGRVAEEMVFGEDEVTSGASSDLMQATMLAQEMVTKYGMSDSVGPVFHSKDRVVSPQTREAIDQEVRTILSSSYERARNLLKTNRGALDKIAKGLLEYETLTGDEVKRLMKGKKIRVDDPPKKLKVQG